MMELIRRVVRNRIGYQSPTYRLAALLYTDGSILLREGIGTYVRLRHLRAAEARASKPEAITFRQLAHPFFVRAGTADIGTAINNFVRREYGAFAFPKEPRTLIDAGAYIGDTSAYFLSRFPEIQVVALEPNPESLELATRNLAPYGNRVTLLAAALSETRRTINLQGAETGARITDANADGVPVETVTIPDVLEQFPTRRVDILKMDIEGAENEIFSGDVSKWLPRVGCIVVETHGPEITENVLSCLQRNGWHTVRHRNLYFSRPRP